MECQTPLKVCDTSISMIRFHKRTLFGFDYGFTRAMYFKTSFSRRVGATRPPAPPPLYSVKF